MITMLTFNSGSIEACGHNDIILEKVKLGLNKTEPWIEYVLFCVIYKYHDEATKDSKSSWKDELWSKALRYVCKSQELLIVHVSH